MNDRIVAVATKVFSQRIQEIVPQSNITLVALHYYQTQVNIIRPTVHSPIHHTRRLLLL